MIFYFTGTGNSLYLAKKLGELTGDEVFSIAEIMAGKPMPACEGVVGLVFPTYAWAPPEIVLDFVEKHLVEDAKDIYFYAIASCAGSVGNLMHYLEKAAGRSLDAAFSVKSGIVAPIFHKYASSTKPFYAEDTCITCGECEWICPMRNIKVDKKPVWGNNCSMCARKKLFNEAKGQKVKVAT
ncbi:EFR1 family ferrodoxin [Enterococcus nangangensis]|uniref:EFR1 family ferrodoxin n=1 Tax=Enterococcus nangangensis TaxID=2559926 RepID=UPI0010F60C8B|nr:EFR1 family ferrodoxin [Enterococcus nangangensis]